MPTTILPITAPSNETVSAFLKIIIPQITTLQKATLPKAKSIFYSIFDGFWANYHNSRWKGRKKNGGGVAAWICNNDCSQNTRLLNHFLQREIQHPVLPISEFTMTIAAQIELPLDDVQELQRIERSHQYLSVNAYAWELVAMHKFCLYCLNNSKSEQQVGKKVIDLIDWTWSEYFMNLPENEQADFCEMIMKYR